jgi:hypothetical protein
MRVLFVSANPRSTAKLDLADELRGFFKSLRGQDVDLTLLPAAQPKDLEVALKGGRFDILHFSGHAAEDGIWFRRPNGLRRSLPVETLRGLLEGQDVRLVILNACNTGPVAQGISGEVEAVIGTRDKVDDIAAKVLTETFYAELGGGASIKRAYESATLAVTEEELPNVYSLFGAATGEPFLEAKKSGGVAEGVKISGQGPWDKFFYLGYIDDQIRSVICQAKFDRVVFVGLLIIGVVASVRISDADSLWAAVVAIVMYTVDLIRDLVGKSVNGNLNLATSSVTEIADAVSAAVPAFLSVLHSRLLVHHNAEVKSLRKLRDITQAADELSPDLRKQLATILDQSIGTADNADIEPLCSRIRRIMSAVRKAPARLARSFAAWGHRDA